MHVLALAFEASPYSNDHQVRPVIDGVDVLRVVTGDALGLDPTDLFRQQALGRAGKLLIGRCSCGDIGCGPVLVDIAVADECVTWQFDAERAYCFELQQYLTCFERASLDRAWETVGRAAERLVTGIDFSKLREQGYEFDWASTRINHGCVTLSFLRDGKQRLFQIGWDDLHAEDAEKRVRQWVAQY